MRPVYKSDLLYIIYGFLWIFFVYKCFVEESPEYKCSNNFTSSALASAFYVLPNADFRLKLSARKGLNDRIKNFFSCAQGRI